MYETQNVSNPKMMVIYAWSLNIASMLYRVVYFTTLAVVYFPYQATFHIQPQSPDPGKKQYITYV